MVSPELNRNWSAGAAALVGYSMVVSQGLMVQAGVGLGASYAVRVTKMPSIPGLWDDRTRSSHVWGFAERATLAVGWAF